MTRCKMLRGCGPRVIAATATLLLATVASLPAPAARAQAADESAPGATTLYLDSLLRAPLTHWLGYHRYDPGVRMLNGVPLAHSLMTSAINNSLPITQYSAITFTLAGRYDRFRATVGRDDVEQTFGPAYCLFEIWGDGTKLYRSEAVRSPLTTVITDSQFPKRSTPAEIDVPIRGVQSLRLVTRFANEFTQQARYVNRAYGCVWGDARVVALPDAGPLLNGPSSESALHATLRRAALRLLEALRRSTPPGGSATAIAAAPRLAVTPLRVDFGFADSPLRRGTGEPEMRAVIADTLYGFRHAGMPLVAAVAAPEAAALAAALPPDSPARSDPAAVAALGRKAHADLLLLGAVRPSGAGWEVNLRVVETVHGRSVQTASEAIRPDTPTMDVASP